MKYLINYQREFFLHLIFYFNNNMLNMPARQSDATAKTIVFNNYISLPCKPPFTSLKKSLNNGIKNFLIFYEVCEFETNI